jgi:hypothetical protein
MNSKDNASDDTEQNSNQEFFEKAERSLRDLFDRAQAAHELHFAMALMPEFRGSQDPGWSTADESVRAYGEFSELVMSMPKPRRGSVSSWRSTHTSRRGPVFMRFRRSCC